MMKRNEWDGLAAPWEVEEFGSTSNIGMVESDALVEVDLVSPSVSHAEPEAGEASSPTSVPTLNFERVVSPSRSEVDPISRGASSSTLRAALCIFRCRAKL